MLSTATGVTYPNVVQSTLTQMTIVFYSNPSFNATGFHIHWFAVGSKCAVTQFIYIFYEFKAIANVMHILVWLST